MTCRHSRLVQGSWFPATAILLAAAAAPALWPSAALGQPQLSDQLQRSLAWQLALEREGFSPGLIDGRPGAKTTLATLEFQQARGLALTGQFDQATAAALWGVQTPSVLSTYTIRAEDPASVTGIPRSWQDKAQMAFLGYESLPDALAERFHCSRRLLEQLNGQVDLAQLSAGDTITVPAIAQVSLARAHHLDVNFSQKVIRAVDANGRVIALFHCSIAAQASKRPSRDARIISVAADPVYHFDPAMWPEVKTVHRKLLIPPGPRNPVGLCWIGLDLNGYGIHGTPKPHLIGKTGSHGCFRLANWDALRLARIVRPGMMVRFVAGEVPATVIADADR